MRLAQSLPGTMLSSKEDSTGKNYLYAFARRKEWAKKKNEFAVFPVNNVQFALYLQDLAETTDSRAAVEAAANAVSWVYQLCRFGSNNSITFLACSLSRSPEEASKAEKEEGAYNADKIIW